MEDHPHLDYGYAVTSHSGQGQTTDRVLIHVDTELGEQLVNERLAYVAVSRARYDAQIYTDDQEHLAHDLSRDVSHRTAITAGEEYDHEQDQNIGEQSESATVGSAVSTEQGQAQALSEGVSQGIGE